jgi:hypothetical protein
MEEFAYIQVKKSDLLELHRALLARWLVEDKLRQTQGLESVSPPPLMDRIETLLGLNAEQSHDLFHRVEDELWEYSWGTFTEEWAWHRAEQDVHKQLGSKHAAMDKAELEMLVEKRYEAKLETYTKEISLEEKIESEAATPKAPTKARKKS